MVGKVEALLKFRAEDSFVSIREVQKSPSRALNGFKIILNNGKLMGIYIPEEELDEYAEDLEALASPVYCELIKKARSEKKIVPAEDVWKDLAL